MGATTVVVGDHYTVGGRDAVVTRVIRQTAGDGTVTLGEPDITLSVEMVSGVPLADVDDGHFAAFILASGDRYAVGLYHPGLGTRIAPAPMALKPIDETIIAAWLCPDITIRERGVAVEGAHVSFVLRRAGTEDEVVEHWYGADRFVDVGSGVEGEWRTDASGIVKHERADGSALEDIYFPRGHNALFQRVTDLRDPMAQPPGEHMQALWCYHKGHRVQVVEGIPAVIDFEGSTVTIAGEPNARAHLALYHASDQPAGYHQVAYNVVLDGAGDGTINNVIAGEYVVWQRPEEVGPPWSKVSPRKWLTVPEGGTNVNIDLGAMVAAPGAGLARIDVYDYGADAVSVDFYQGIAPCDYIASGSSLVHGVGDSFVVKTADTGYYVDSINGGDGCYEVTLRQKVLIIYIDDEGNALGNTWWRGSDGHRDFFRAIPVQYQLVEVDGLQPTVEFDDVPIGLLSEEPTYPWPAPTMVEGPPNEWAWADHYFWEVRARDGTVIAPITTWPEGDGLYDGDPIGSEDIERLTIVIEPDLRGGKLSGNVVALTDDEIEQAALPEAARMGLEFGRWQPVIEVRVIDDEGAAAAARTVAVCPYCQGPTHRFPSTVDYTFGYCTQCGSDARTYMRSPTVPEGGYDVRVVAYTPQQRIQVLLARWLRPVNYVENDDYVVANYAGLGLVRWVCQHPVLATWDGAFTDGDDADAIGAANGLDDPAYVQPKLAISALAGTGTYIIGAVLAGAVAHEFRATLAPGAATPWLLTQLPKIGGATPGGDAAAVHFADDITSIAADEQIPGGNLFTVVGDVPGLVQIQTPIEDLADTPWACQFLALPSDLAQFRGADGFTHVYVTGPDITHWWLDATGEWNSEVVISARTHGRICAWPEHGKSSPAHLVIVEAEAGAGRNIHCWRNAVAGHADSWEELSMPWEAAELIAAVDCPQRGEVIVVGHDQATGALQLKRGLRMPGGFEWQDPEAVTLTDPDTGASIDIDRADMEQLRGGQLSLVAIMPTGQLIRAVSGDAGLSWTVEDIS